MKPNTSSIISKDISNSLFNICLSYLKQNNRISLVGPSHVSILHSEKKESHTQRRGWGGPRALLLRGVSMLSFVKE